jgi:D-sedoheptulose 7-phosphate isomerase
MDYRCKLKAYLNKEKEVIDSLNIEDINSVLNVFEDARLQGKRIFICGNGGSAATASHFAADFNKGVNEVANPTYDFECLSDNIPELMAIANDYDYSEVFRWPLKHKMKKGDIVVGISGSGNSMNVVKAIEYAKEHGNVTVAFVGYNGGKLKELADHVVHVNIDNMQITEDIHMIMDHLMMYTLTNL